jgi:hypothetical protein
MADCITAVFGRFAGRPQYFAFVYGSEVKNGIGL